MLRLVTQFDDPRTRPVVATPTCTACCSCCCCCCVSSTITTATYTAMNLDATAKRAGMPESRVRSVAGLGGLTFILVPTTIAVILLFVAVFQPETSIGNPLVVLLIAASWPLALYSLYQMAGHERPGRAAFGTWVVGVVLFSLEIVWGAYTLLTFGIGYLLLAALVAAGGIKLSSVLTND